MTETLQRNYKATFILDTREYEQPVEELVSKIEDALRELGANVAENRNLGRQEFIRVTNRHHTGDIYVQIDFAAGPEAPAAIQERFRLDRTVKRVMVESV